MDGVEVVAVAAVVQGADRATEKTTASAQAGMIEVDTMKRFRGAYLYVLAACLAGASVTAAELDGTYTDAKTIDKVLASIPFTDKSMNYANLGERLPNLGLRVEYINVGKFTADDIKFSQGSLRRGDVDYRFSTNEPNNVVKEICPVLRSFNLIRRGGKWIPHDRTSNFLVNGYGHCVAP